MASNTPNLNLLKKDPAVDGNDTFNIKTMLNDNWDKIDTAMGDIPDQVADLAKTAVTYKEWPTGVNSINGLVDIGVYYVPDLSKYTNIPSHPAGGTNTAWSGANAIINVYNVQPPYVGPAALRVVELYITLGTSQYFYRRNTKLSVSNGQTTITHGSWERIMTTNAAGRLQLDDVSGSIPLAIGAGSARTRWGFHVDAGGSMHIAPSTTTGGTDSFNFDKGIAINSTTGMVTVETSLRVNNGRLNVYNSRNSVAQYEPSGEWAGRIINFADAPTEHGLVVGNRWGANESTVFLAGASGMGSSFQEFFRISGNGKIYMRDTGDKTIDLAATLADLKQSGVNYKNNLVAALNASGVAANSGEDWNALINKINIISTYIVTNTTSNGNNLYVPAGRFRNRVDVKGNDSYSGNIGYLSTVQSQRISLRVADISGRDYELYAYNTGGSFSEGFYIKNIIITSTYCDISGTVGASNPRAFSQHTDFGSGFNLQSGFRFYFVYNTGASSTSYSYGWYSNSVYGG